MARGFLVLLLFFSSTAMAAESLELELQSLKDVSVTRLKLSGAKPQMLMVFQADCFACRKQVTDLECLDIPVTLLGAFSPEKALRREHRRMQTSLEAYYINRSTLQKMGISAELTPQMLLLVRDKKFLFQGLTSCQFMKEKLGSVI